MSETQAFMIEQRTGDPTIRLKPSEYTLVNANPVFTASVELATRINQLWEKWWDEKLEEDGFVGGVLADFLEDHQEELEWYEREKPVLFRSEFVKTVECLRANQLDPDRNKIPCTP